MLDIQKLYSDYSIDTPSSIDKHTRDGWVQTYCPFCNSSGYHLGYNTYAGYFNCWRCGWHSEYQTLKELLNLSASKIKEIFEFYTISGIKTLPKNLVKKAEKCELPFGTIPLRNNHRKYLIKRKFNSKHIEEQWGVKGTLSFDDYANRIIIPITHNGILCSYQGRDITENSYLRYKACKSVNEVINHQDLIYGFDEAREYKQCIVVEGVFDTWRLGFGAVSVFGIEFSKNQIFLLAKNFKKVYIMFDNELVAQRQAKKLQSELLFRGVECEIANCNYKDPAEMPQEEANKLMTKLGFY